VKFFWHSLIPFLTFLLNHLPLSSPELHQILDYSWLFYSTTQSLLFYTLSRILTVPTYTSSARTPRKTQSSVVKNACLLVRRLAIDVLLLGALLCGNVFTDPLPSNGYTYYNTLTDDRASQRNKIMNKKGQNGIQFILTSFSWDPFRKCLFVWATGGLSSSSKTLIRIVIPTSLIERPLFTVQVTWTRSSGPGPKVPASLGPVSLSRCSRLCKDTPSLARLAYSVPVWKKNLYCQLFTYRVTLNFYHTLFTVCLLISDNISSSW
jgi:hypothetical protein